MAEPTTRTITSPEEMQAFAAEVATQLRGGERLWLVGELGSGKTTFVKALGAALGVIQPITSPTFTVMAQYPVAQHPTVRRLIHLDLYRLEAKAATTDAMVQEALAPDPTHVIIVEWADRLGPVSPEGYHIQFAHGTTAEERVITITHAP
jgi:tRNA threonylcarbamoyladenosine biosynthesis protein TsaE